ncbi:MAG: winged helix-turn-helix transcriptional regulator [Proteobacteria bacterium]|nr:winged helix-turn-helix transcriptional regulator [Pseudomonadota bacterium]MBS0571842.1 winged helix-turn-helix transcriptional regulator [Pseudomonadota bacterium]
MVQHESPPLDLAFSALADPTRRGILERLSQADASVTALAERFAMSLTGMKKHLSLLEEARLVQTRKVGRTRTCRLAAPTFDAQLAWMSALHQTWAARFTALDAVLDDLPPPQERTRA